MKQIELVIQNPSGLHARPAKVLVNLAKQFKSDVSIFHQAKKANAKSMVSVLTLGAANGSNILLQVNGEDEDDALIKLESAIRSGLGDNDHHPATAVPSAPTPPASLPTTTPPAIPAGALMGIGAAPGIAIGPIFHYQHEHLNLDTKPTLSLKDALAIARNQLFNLQNQMTAKMLSAEAAIFEAHAELLEDPELLESFESQVQAGQTAVRAWQTTIEGRAANLATLPDPTLSARSADLLDVGRRVLRLMLGVSEKGVTLPSQPIIIIARDLSPSDTASFDTQNVLGFCIVEGGPTSHIAILARAMGLPAIVGADEAVLTLPAGAPAILNGTDGALTPNPQAEQLEQAQASQRRWHEYRFNASAQAALPALTQDGHHVDVTANAGSPADAQKALENFADGIGLLRTEFLFLERATAPGEDDQFEIYRAIATTMQNRPVIVRTLDIGGDKPLPYIRLKPEMNPFLGERGIRLCMNRPELFSEQLRAILRASAHGNLRIMFPMVSDVGEIRQARQLIEQLRKEVHAPEIQIGIMVEVPSAALLADKLAPEIDFFSIGTNDLTQYTLAVDRGNSVLASKHDGLHPAVLRLIAHTIHAAHKFGKRADLCGELGSDLQAVPVLIGLGIDELSVSIPSIPTVKAQVRTLHFSNTQALAQQALECSTAQEVRELVKKHFASS